MRTRIAPVTFAGGFSIDVTQHGMQGRLHNRLFTQRDQQLILLLICEVLLYICTNLLYSINITYSAITSKQPKSGERLHIEAFISYFSTPFLIIINNCAPFYLYLIVSSKFRQDVKKLFITCCTCLKIRPERDNVTVEENKSVENGQNKY